MTRSINGNDDMTILPPASTDSSINAQKHYLATEFHRYFPDAVEIAVHHANDGETISVLIVNAEPRLDIEFRMDIGSDDDYYVFENDLGSIITVPLAGDDA